MSTGKRKKQQIRLLNEIRDQLVLQAGRWGKKDHYTQLCLDEMTLDQCYRVLGDLFSEKANLEYELYLLESDKHDLLIKMERLDAYLKKSRRVIKKYQKNIQQQLDKLIGDKDKLDLIEKRMHPENTISVLLSNN